MDQLFSDLGLTVVCAASLACAAVILRQPLLVSYIAAGIIFGPFGLGVLKNTAFIDSVSRLGITLLLFLAGLSLPPKKLLSLFRESLVLTLFSGLLIFGAVWLAALLLGFPSRDGLLIAAALTFSSTILVVKLIPALTLHQKYMGALCIAILIAQDLMAVSVLVFLKGIKAGAAAGGLIPFIAGGALFIPLLLLIEQAVLRPLIARMEFYHEVLYLIALGWCLGVALVAEKLGFSLEIGAFLAGIAFARNPVADFFSEGLKVFRDFFLMLFFFVMGTKIDLRIIREIIVGALIISALLVLIKTTVYAWILRLMGKERKFAMEVGVRMNSASEFALIISLFAGHIHAVSGKAVQLIQITTVITMMVSSYLTVAFFPTPLGRVGGLKQD